MECTMSVKTHKGIHKRFKRTATGKVLRRRSGKRHLMSTKSARRARRLSGWHPVSKPDLKAMERQYGRV
jgi:large subunit ribosomal protein L35